ncbi:hypothetical protein ACSDQ9_09130 [Aestuariimicrobium soli]|uniref:hypothetical protein n=1 Tax=Aestuariimicrobium soli TaxID=2035834 RepID=UPI003EC08D55
MTQTRRTTYGAALIGATLLLGAAACDGSTAGESVTPVVPTTATPSTTPTTKASTPTPSASTPADLPSAPSTVIPTATGSQPPNSPALLKEAEAVVRIYVYESLKAESQAQTTLSPELEATVMDPYRTQLLTYLKDVKKDGLTFENVKAAEVTGIRPTQSQAKPGWQAAVSACRKFDRVTVIDKTGKRMPGPVYRDQFFLKRSSNGQLRIFGVVTELADKC